MFYIYKKSIIAAHLVVEELCTLMSVSDSTPVRRLNVERFQETA